MPFFSILITLLSIDSALLLDHVGSDLSHLIFSKLMVLGVTDSQFLHAIFARLLKDVLYFVLLKFVKELNPYLGSPSKDDVVVA